MRTIISGQYAAQFVARYRTKVRPFIIQDTDLLSTLVYYKLWNNKWPKICEDLFQSSRSDLYILMNDQIPFESDPLRYGGNKRETGNDFWKDLLVQFNCPFYEVEEVKPKLQELEIEQVITKLFNTDTEPFTKFIREKE